MHYFWLKVNYYNALLTIPWIKSDMIQDFDLKYFYSLSPLGNKTK